MDNKVTILCTSYNQENYIKQALDSFVMQKTNFGFEVIIGDDCSTDNTQRIIKEYAQKYPHIIKPIFREKNLGPNPNFVDVASRVKTEFVALCEGDDYWTDEFKLQKQVDMLDANPDYALCFHNVRFFHDDGAYPDMIFPSIQQRYFKTVLGLEDLIHGNFIQTNSVMYRWRFNENEKISDVFPEDILPGDWFLHMLHARNGKIGFIDEVMADYRIHRGGLWWGSQSEEHQLKCGLQKLRCFLEIEKTFPEYLKIIGHGFTITVARSLFNIYLKNYKFNEMQKVIELCPDVFPNKTPII